MTVKPSVKKKIIAIAKEYAENHFKQTDFSEPEHESEVNFHGFKFTMKGLERYTYHMHHFPMHIIDAGRAIFPVPKVKKEKKVESKEDYWARIEKSTRSGCYQERRIKNFFR